MVNWYYNRLRTMSGAEFIFRLKRVLHNYFKEKRTNQVKLTSNEFIPGPKILEVQPIPVNTNFEIVNIFGSQFDLRAGQVDWQKDIFSGEAFPLIFHSKINILGNRNLSAKSVWEINRLQFLTLVCLSYKSKKNKNDLDLFVSLIKSWSARNPYLTGINWYSNIEVNLRLITWFLCWEILDAEREIRENSDFRKFADDVWFPLLKEHCIYSFENPSKYSSSNNHLISEYAGLFIASSKWHFNDSAKWNSYAKAGLENEIIRQHSNEGINKEEAAEYIQFITDFFLLSLIVGEKTNNPFSVQYRERLYKIFTYIYDILDIGGNFPKYGDDDNGRCFVLESDKYFNNFRSLLTSGAIIFSDPAFKSKSNGFDTKNEILFGESGRILFDSIPENDYSEGSKMYAEEGHFIIRKKNKGRELFMHFDAAPLGFLSIAAHGHADALSFILNVDGQPVIVDPGTYTYHTDPAWRNYFIGTLAHNTVRINQKDQAVNGGPTLWIRHYKTEVIDSELNGNIERIKATHDGYSGENVRHEREVKFDKTSDEFQITDEIVLTKRQKTKIEMVFHLHPEIRLSRAEPNHFILERKSIRNTELAIDEKLNTSIIKGQTEPFILGWFSDSFLKKEPTPVILCTTEIENTTIFKTKIKIHQNEH